MNKNEYTHVDTQNQKEEKIKKQRFRWRQMSRSFFYAFALVASIVSKLIKSSNELK